MAKRWPRPFIHFLTESCSPTPTAGFTPPRRPLRPPPTANERVYAAISPKNCLVANVTEFNALPCYSVGCFLWRFLVSDEFDHARPFITITASATSFLFRPLLPPSPCFFSLAGGVAVVLLEISTVPLVPARCCKHTPTWTCQ
jgi:hypothetical protein